VVSTIRSCRIPSWVEGPSWSSRTSACHKGNPVRQFMAPTRHPEDLDRLRRLSRTSTSSPTLGGPYARAVRAEGLQARTQEPLAGRGRLHLAATVTNRGPLEGAHVLGTPSARTSAPEYLMWGTDSALGSTRIADRRLPEVPDPRSARRGAWLSAPHRMSSRPGRRLNAAAHLEPQYHDHARRWSRGGRSRSDFVRGPARRRAPPPQQLEEHADVHTSARRVGSLRYRHVGRSAASKRPARGARVGVLISAHTGGGGIAQPRQLRSAHRGEVREDEREGEIARESVLQKDYERICSPPPVNAQSLDEARDLPG